MNRRNNILCTSCEEIIGSYPVFSHAHDEQDTGDAEYNENYGGKIEGDDYCFDCYHAILNKNDGGLMEEVYESFAETDPARQYEEMIQVAAVAVQIIECLKRSKEQK